MSYGITFRSKQTSKKSSYSKLIAEIWKIQVKKDPEKKENERETSEKTETEGDSNYLNSDRWFSK